MAGLGAHARRPLPVYRGTRIKLLGSDGSELAWRRDDQDGVVVTMPQAGPAATTSEHAYVLKITTPGVNGLLRTDLEVPQEIPPGTSAAATLTVTNTSSRAFSLPTEVTVAGPHGWRITPSRAVDGNTDGTYSNGSVTHAAEPSNQGWWQVDLGASANLARVDVWNRSDSCCTSRLQDYWVIVSDDPITAQTLEAARSVPRVTAVHVTEQAGRPSAIQLPAGATGRYVRVQLASADNPAVAGRGPGAGGDETVT